MTVELNFVLIVEDDAAHAAAIGRALVRGMPGIKVQVAGSLAKFHEMVAAEMPDVVLMDMNLPDGRALDVLISGAELPYPVLIMTAGGCEKWAVEAMKAGALDYIVKSAEVFAAAPQIVQRLWQDWQLQQARKEYDRLLVESEDRYRKLFEANPLPMWVYDRESLAFLAVNGAAVAHYGYSREEFLGMTMWQLLPPEDVPNVSPGMARQNTNVDVAGYKWHCKNDGSRIQVDITLHALDFAGRRARLMLANDVTERKRTEDALRESERRFRDMLANVQLISMMLDREGRVTFCNDYLLRLTGWRREEVLGVNWFERFIPAENEELKGVLAALFENLPAAWHHENEILTRSGERRLIRWSNSVLWSASGEVIGAASIGEDITERTRAEAQLKHLATHDKLTGLANRALLLDRLDQSLHFARRSGRLVAVLLLDLDRFKVVNDSLGHDFGDQLLCAVAQRLQQCVRDADTVARLGGDEFVVLLAEVAEIEDVALVARKILNRLNAPYHIASREVTVTASFGISVFPRDSEDGPTLFRNADMAMYRAKNHHRNDFCFYSTEMNRQAMATLELENDLRQALAREEFCLYYQPKIELASGRIVGCEALLRWRHPQRGMVSPVDFIPLAEETGLIVPIGIWALREACRQVKAWQQARLPDLSVAVNLSARQFRKGDLPQLVNDILNDIGLEARFLELELTESMVMCDPGEAERTMRALKILGVGLSLDDFGTGYSSLNYLRRFAVDSLKIDQSFIRDVFDDAGGAAVVTSIIDIAHNLGLSAIAEGVETREQLLFLHSVNCDMYQGHLCSRPLPASEFAELLRS